MSETNTLTERLAEYSSKLNFADLPQEVVHEAKRVTVDAIGCAIGAWKEEPPVVVRDIVQHFRAEPANGWGSTVWGTRCTTTSTIRHRWPCLLQ